MKTKVELLEEIVRKQDELIKISDELTTVGSSLSSLQDSAMFGDRFNRLSNQQDYLYEKYKEIKAKVDSLKSRLAEEKEEDVYTKSLRLLTEFMDKTPSEEIAVELRKIANKAGEEKELISTGRDCVSCFYGYITRFDEEPCSSCDRDIYSNWQPR